jgi:uncharacterized protein YndB with AHSA1/START domain
MSADVQVRRRYSFPPERVFDAWLDPALAGRFLFATPAGTMVKVEIDARVGGRFNIVERRDGQDAVHVGAYLEIDRPRRLVFSFGDSLAFDATRVTVEISPTPDGCELVLTHVGVGSEWTAQTTQGWTDILDSLGGVLAN